jgi:hypothetical protein
MGCMHVHNHQTRVVLRQHVDAVQLRQRMPKRWHGPWLGMGIGRGSQGIEPGCDRLRTGCLCARGSKPCTLAVLHTVCSKPGTLAVLHTSRPVLGKKLSAVGRSVLVVPS